MLIAQRLNLLPLAMTDTLLLAGRRYAEWGPRAAARLRGWLGQDRSDPFASSVLDTVLTGRHPHLSRWAWESATDSALARAALAAMGLSGCFARRAREDGVAVAMVLHDPNLALRYCDQVVLLYGDSRHRAGRRRTFSTPRRCPTSTAIRCGRSLRTARAIRSSCRNRKSRPWRAVPPVPTCADCRSIAQPPESRRCARPAGAASRRC
jgi:ABC-type cobalamin/Fe3+-siderophores transport system ATPase subunit